MGLGFHILCTAEVFWRSSKGFEDSRTPSSLACIMSLLKYALDKMVVRVNILSLVIVLSADCK